MRFARTRVSQALAAALSLGAVPLAGAQVVRDGTVGPSGAGAVSPTAISSPKFTQEFKILAADGQRSGANLFHSFSQFDIAATQRANFSGPADVTNIISRVTGGNPSLIRGGIRSEISGANVFLLNPSGIFFGENASLDISGSFHASTANYLAFSSGERFQTSATPQPVLSSAPPSAFGFLGAPAGIAVNRSTLSVVPGAALTLTGGTLALTGATLTAPGGFFGLASAAGPGEIALTPSDLLPGASMLRGAIELTNGATVSATTIAGVGGGRVVIRGGMLTLREASTVSLQNDGAAAAQGIVVDATQSVSMTGASTSISSTSSGPGPGGEILIVTPTLTMQGAIVSANVSGTGAAGSLRIQSGQVALSDGAQILAASLGAGAAGDVTIDATTSLDLSGRGNGRVSGVFTVATESGAAGDIVIRTPALTVDNGNIGADALSSGAPGNLTIEGDRVAIIGGAAVTATTRAPGPGSTLRITASESVVLSGQDANGNRSVILGTNNGDGSGTTVVISAPVITVDQGDIRAAALGNGPGGDITLDGARVAFTNGGQISSNSTAAGRTGAVTIRASESIAMSGTFGTQSANIAARALGTGDGGTVSLTAPVITLDGASVNVSTVDTGAAGDIMVSTAKLALTNGATLNASTTGRGLAGKVAVVASESIEVSGRGAAGPSSIASAASGIGSAGEVTLTAPLVTVDGGVISGDTSGAGTGGSIVIATGVLDVRNDGRIVSTSSASGAGGRIAINASESVTITSPSASLLGSGVFATSSGRGRGGDIEIDSPTVNVAGGSIAASALGAGDAGRVTLRGGNIAVAGGGLIDSSALSGSGAAGVVNVAATNALTISGRGLNGITSTISSATDGTGAGGDIQLSAPTITLSDALVSANTSGRGAAGRIGLDAQRVVISNGGIIASGTSAAGDGGTVNIAATESILITGRNGPNRSRITNSSSGSGNAGATSISAPSITLENDGFVRGTASDQGNAGRISVSGGTLSLASGGEVSTSTTAQGMGGAIDIVVSGSVGLSNGAIRSTSAGPGDAGSITVQGRRVSMTRGGVIDSSSTVSGNAGIVLVDAVEAIEISGNASAISSAVAGTARGGEVILRAPLVTIDQGKVSADAQGSATAGQITIVAPRVTLADGARVSSSTLEDAVGGKVNITASDAVTITDSGASLTSAGIFTTSGGRGRGGDVQVTAPTVSVAGGSIAASAFGTGDAGNITVQGARVAVTAGGLIDSSSSLTATAGRILLDATESIEVSGNNGAGTRTTISSKALGTGRGGEIILKAPVVTLDRGRVQADALGGGIGGQVSVEATRVSLTNAGQLSSSATGAGDGGKVSVVASESVTITDTVADASGAGLRATTSGRGRSGEIDVRTPTLRVEGGSIATTTFAAGDAGRITIQGGDIAVSGGGLIDSSSLGGLGAAGVVSVAATNALTISGKGADGTTSSTISSATSGPGAGGDIQLSASTFTLDDALVIANTSGRGPAGRVGLDAQRVVISNGGIIASGTTAAGDGGTVNVAATESILITGRNGPSRSRITNSSSGSGNAGSISMSAPSITLENDGFVRGTASDRGNAGRISIRGGNLSLTSGADVSTSTEAQGNGGAIDIVFSGSVGLTDSSIRSTSTGNGDAGNIFIDAGRSLRMASSSITTEAARADGGNIEIMAIDLLHLKNSRITTSVGTGFGNGGNITIDPTFVILDGSQIIANAFGGNGGNINITTDALVRSGDSVIQASSQLGIQGTITINAPDSDLAGGLTPLQGGLFDPSQLLRESCSARAGRAGNSFTGVGHGGLPERPGTLAFSSYAPTGTVVGTGRASVFALADVFASACAR